MNNDETYYDVLKVAPRASIPEIVAAYHKAKSAFSGDSVATYSLMDGDETKEILRRIDEAYQVLTNVEKRTEYDRILHNRAEEAAGTKPDPFTRAFRDDKASEGQTDTPLPAAKPSTKTLDTVDGLSLRAEREACGYSIEDVARITKIQKKFLNAIEEVDRDNLPARVYIFGFIKNLATHYRLSTEHTTQQYLKMLDGDPDEQPEEES